MTRKFSFDPISVEIIRYNISRISDKNAPKKLLNLIVDYAVSELFYAVRRETPLIRLDAKLTGIKTTKRDIARRPMKYLIDLGFLSEAGKENWYMANPCLLDYEIKPDSQLISIYKKNGGKQISFPPQYLERFRKYDNNKTLERTARKRYKPVDILGTTYIPKNIAEEERMKTMKINADNTVGNLREEIMQGREEARKGFEAIMKLMTPEQKEKVSHLNLITSNGELVK